MIEITEDGASPKVRVRPTYDDAGNQQLISPPEEYRPILYGLANDLRLKLKSNHKNHRFVHTTANVRMRGTIFQTEREKWIVLRRIPPLPFNVGEIGFSQSHTKMIQAWTDMPGLILICGGFGSGKTTTAASFFTDHLERNGGLGITAESPPEYFLQGTVNEHTLCFQIPIEPDDDFQWSKTAADIRTAAPSIIYIGEILNSTIANITLDLAMTARPVIATSFGADPAEAIEHMLSLAAAKDPTTTEHKRQLLSKCLTGISHQVLVNGKPRVEIFNVAGSDHLHVRQMIAQSEGLSDEINRQNAQDHNFDHYDD
jgi:Tfp pilus assembly pilus retraction ATPase PilT